MSDEDVYTCSLTSNNEDVGRCLAVTGGALNVTVYSELIGMCRELSVRSKRKRKHGDKHDNTKNLIPVNGGLIVLSMRDGME